MNYVIHMTKNNENLTNCTTIVLNLGGCLNASQYSNLQASSDQNTTQQPRQGLLQSAMSNQIDPLSGEGYVMNAADLASSGNLYGPVSSGVLHVATSLNGMTR